MTERLNIQQPSSDPNEFGELEKGFTTVATRWASVTALKATEQFKAGQDFGVTSYTVTMRPYPGISSKWRLEQDGTIYNIEGILNDDPLSMLCTVKT